MRKIPSGHIKFAATVFCLTQSAVTVAEERWISGGLGASQLWDSNFFQNPDEISEQIQVYTAGVRLAANLSRQQFSARWNVRSYQHVENKQYDETLQTGLVNWSGAWAGDFTTSLDWGRDSYIVDRWVASESDVVEKDDAKFTLVHGAQNRFSFSVGARETNQNHSSEIRSDFNYREKEAFAGITYKTPSLSTLSVFYRGGDRTYVDRTIEDLNFDFDYDQVDIENVWKISDKTTSTLTLSRLERKGVFNNSTGDYAILDLSWDATPKVKWHAGYSYKRPALGETIDMPSKIQTGFVGFSWEITPKLEISSRAEKLLRNYDNPDELFVRTESQYNLIPIAMSYEYSESLTIRLDTSWHKNESPILVRQYKSNQVLLGLTFRF